MSRLADLERELTELQSNPHDYIGNPHERTRQLKVAIAVEKWLETFGPTDRERD